MILDGTSCSGLLALDHVAWTETIPSASALSLQPQRTNLWDRYWHFPEVPAKYFRAELFLNTHSGFLLWYAQPYGFKLFKLWTQLVLETEVSDRWGADDECQPFGHSSFLRTGNSLTSEIFYSAWRWGKCRRILEAVRKAVVGSAANKMWLEKLKWSFVFRESSTENFLYQVCYLISLYWTFPKSCPLYVYFSKKEKRCFDVDFLSLSREQAIQVLNPSWQENLNKAAIIPSLSLAFCRVKIDAFLQKLWSFLKLAHINAYCTLCIFFPLLCCLLTKGCNSMCFSPASPTFFFTYTFNFSVPSAFNLLNVTLQLLMTEDIKCHGSYFIAKDGMQTFFKWFQII